MIYESFFQNVACGLLVCKNDPYSTIITANDAFYKMIGYTRDEMQEIYQNQFLSLILDDLSEILKQVEDTTMGRLTLDYEFRIRVKSGKTMWIHDVATYDPDKDVFYVVIMDITSKEKLLEQVALDATLDKITGLLNRGAFENQINRMVVENNGQQPQTMFLIDLDNFKTINDEKGHQVGDKVIKLVGNRLRKILKHDFTVGRLGGDEFMVYSKELYTIDEIEKWAQMIGERLRIKAEFIQVTASIGICFNTCGDYTFKELYTATDKALYKAKANGKNQYNLIITH